MAKNQTITLNMEAFLSAWRNGDELTRELAKLIAKFGSEPVTAVAASLGRKLWVPLAQAPTSFVDGVGFVPASGKGRAGRPPEWSDEGKLYAWIVIEGQWRADRRRKASISLTASITAKLKSLRRRQWTIFANNVKGTSLSIGAWRLRGSITVMARESSESCRSM